MSDTFKLVPFKAVHIMPMLEQPINIAHRDQFTNGVAEWVEQKGCFTGLLGEKPVVCGGILAYWPGRGQIWTMFDENCGGNFVPIFRGIKRYLKEQGKVFKRIEVSIPYDFSIGRRRAEMLGFKLECDRATAFLPDGGDAALYSLVQL